MKKTLIAASLAILSMSAFASNDQGMFVGGEFESERVRPDGANHFTENSLSAIVGHKFQENKVDLKVSGMKDNLSNTDTNYSAEIRYKRVFRTGTNIEPSVRIGVGRNYITNGEDFNYFTVEPKVSYDLKNGFAPFVSVKFKDSFDSKYNDFRATTAYLGVAYKPTRDIEIEPALFVTEGNNYRSTGARIELIKQF